MRLKLNYYLGIDLGGTTIKAGVVREDHSVVCKHKVRTTPDRFAHEIIYDMAEAGKTVLSMAGISETKIRYVGISVPSAVNPVNNHIVYANNLDWKDFDLIPVFKEAWDIPVLLANDGDAAALAEVTAGAAREYTDALMLTLGTGIGGGLIINKKVYAGGDGFGTEPGQLIILTGGELCTCGVRGCFEAYGSVTALTRDTLRAMEKHPGSLIHEICGGDKSRVGGRTAFQAAKRGDETGQKVVDSYIGYLAAGITSLIVLLRPQAVILGGGVCAEGDSLFVPLRERVSSMVYGADVIGSPPILKAALGNDAGFIGAALLGV